MTNMYDMFREYSLEEPSRLFMYDEDRRFSSSQAFSVVDNIAGFMYRMGVRKGHNVAIRSTRSLDTMFLFFAAQFLGAAAVLTDPHEGVVEGIESTGVDIAPEWSLTNEEQSADISARGGWVLEGKGMRRAVEISCSNEGCAYPVCRDAEMPSAIIFTSGSTGKSKGVVLSQRNLICHMQNYEKAGSFEPYDHSIELLPLHHIFGLTMATFALFTRYSLFYPISIDTAYVAEMIEKLGISRIDGVPSYIISLTKQKEEKWFDSSSLRTGLLGGAPCSMEQFNHVEEVLGIQLVPVYGMSECAAISGIPVSEPNEKRGGTVGKFLPMHDGFISDGMGGRAACGEIGEICVKSPVVMLGYYGDEKQTSLAVDKNGALHTGDIGYVDEEGYLYVTGRIKDIIIRNGINISTRKIEKAIQSLPYIDNVAVVGRKDEKAGEIPSALIVLKDGCSMTMDDILRDLSGSLAKNEMPDRMEFTDSIPLTSSGKPDKERIRHFFNMTCSCQDVHATNDQMPGPGACAAR